MSSPVDATPLSPLARFGVANALTSGGIALALLAVLLWCDGAHDAALIAWLLAVGVDQVDGTVARWTDSESRFGALLDAHADAIAYGVAPASFVVAGHPVRWVAGPAALLVVAVVWRCAHQSAASTKDITVGVPACVLAFVLAFAPGPVAPEVRAAIVAVGALLVLGPLEISRRGGLGVVLIGVAVLAFVRLLLRVG